MWAIYALLSAFFVATSDPIAKKALKIGVDEYLIGWAMIFLSTPFLAFFCFRHDAVPINIYKMAVVPKTRAKINKSIALG